MSSAAQRELIDGERREPERYVHDAIACEGCPIELAFEGVA